MYIALLGRQPAIGIAELERVYGDVSWFSDISALVTSDTFDINRLGGTQKAGRVVLTLPRGNWRDVSNKVVQHYSDQWAANEGKITLGISVYGPSLSPREVQKTGIILKARLKKSGTSLRLVPNQEAALNTAASHHNKLGLSKNKVELLIVMGKDGSVIVAESIGAQNITALAKRDQERPKRDAFVGMLPPKLAQIMVNLSLGPISSFSSVALREAPPARGARLALTGTSLSNEETNPSRSVVLDPFCGTGVILQEALLMGHSVIGSDLNPRMIEYTQKNLDWLSNTFHVDGAVLGLSEGDATEFVWKQAPKNISAVATETYLGQPFSAPPSPAKLTEVRGNCNHIIGQFLKNISQQLAPGTPLCVAVPAWIDQAGSFTHLPLISKLEEYGFKRIALKNTSPDQLLYFREGQVVARELLVLEKV